MRLILEPGSSRADLSVALGLCFGTAITSFLFSAARYGIESVSRSKLLKLVPAEGDQRRFERYFESLDRSLVGALLVMLLSDSLFGLSLYVLIRSLLPPEWATAGIFLTAALVSIYLVLCARILARTLVEPDAERLVVRILPFLHGLGLLLSPLTGPIAKFRRRLSEAFGETDKEGKDEAFTEELKATLEEGEREGIVAQDEAAIIENVVEFRDLDVRQVMTPRTDVDWVEATSTVQEALRLASEKGHARLLVGESDSDHVVGIFYVRDILDRIDDLPKILSEPVKTVCREARFVPETKHLVELLKEFRQTKTQIAVVLDEYGGTAGLVTVSDVFEAIVGEFHDEHDPEEQKPSLEVVGADHAVVDGRERIDTVNDALHIELPESEGVDTIGGLVFSTLGRVPQRGETLNLDGVEIKVLEAEERRVKRVEIRVLTRGTS